MTTSSWRTQGIPVALQRTILFVAGLGLMIWEATVYDGPTRWHFIVAYFGMMNLPLPLLADDLRRRRAENGDDP